MIDGYLVSAHVISWAADECERQRSGERSVAWMVNGWYFATTPRFTISRENLLLLAGLVEPRENGGKSFRRVNVTVGGSVPMAHTLVDRAMENLIAAVGDLDPDAWYREYEEIHPLADGNGRTGSILWNWLRGTLDNPEVPPDFWTPRPVTRVRPIL